MKGNHVISPVYLTATYQFDKSDDLIDVVQNRSGYIYSRWDNPSVRYTGGMTGFPFIFFSFSWSNREAAKAQRH